jgi:hypothetical protein
MFGSRPHAICQNDRLTSARHYLMRRTLRLGPEQGALTRRRRTPIERSMPGPPNRSCDTFPDENPGRDLRRQYDELMTSLRDVDEAIADDLLAALTGLFGLITARSGPVAVLTARQQLAYARELVSQAKLQLEEHPGKAYACALLAMHLESFVRPGPDAEIVAAETSDLIEDAFIELADQAYVKAAER